MMHARPVTPADVTAIAESADADERTVIRRLAGLPVRPRIALRIDREIAARITISLPAEALRHG